MPNLNKVMLMGRLTRDPEVRYTPQGTAVAELGLAVNRVWYDQNKEKREEVTFVDVTAWERQAETLGKYVRKGSPIYIEGRLHLSNWETKEGEKRSKLRVRLETFQFLDSASSRGVGGFDEGGPPRRAPAPAAPATDEWGGASGGGASAGGGAPAGGRPVDDDLGLGRPAPDEEVPF